MALLISSLGYSIILELIKSIVLKCGKKIAGTIRNFYSNLFKLFDVDVDFINKQTKFTTSAVAINRCYNIRLRNIKSNYERALKNNS